MLARSGLVGNKSSRPYLGPSEAIFFMDRKNQKNEKKKCLFFLGGALAAIHPGWGNRYVLMSARGLQESGRRVLPLVAGGSLLVGSSALAYRELQRELPPPLQVMPLS